MKIVILCGGLGTRLREETAYRPKPMVEVGGFPILWHIMNIYSYYGYNEFVLALGYKGEMIKEYFLNHRYMHNDFTVQLADGSVTIHPNHRQPNLTVTLADTGEEALKGARVARVARYLEGDRFMVTYGDGIGDVNINRLMAFHREAGSIGTFTGVRIPSRFAAVQTDDKGLALAWQEKPLLESYVNGGFFVFERRFLEYLSVDEGCELEREPLERLAADGQLSMYRHDGFWHPMDTYRDYLLLNDMWRSGRATWANLLAPEKETR